jgi:hypothetical protein
VSHRSAQPVVYRIDADDRIVAVNGAWRAFARENGAPQLAAGAVGRRLWDFVSGRTVVHVWESLFDGVRGGGVATVPYRCDSPDQVRRMEMSLRGFADGSVELVSTTLAVEERPTRVDLVRACSWCNRYLGDEWLELEAAVEELGLLEHEPPITHGICPECLTRLRASAERR